MRAGEVDHLLRFASVLRRHLHHAEHTCKQCRQLRLDARGSGHSGRVLSHGTPAKVVNVKFQRVGMLMWEF